VAWPVRTTRQAVTPLAQSHHWERPTVGGHGFVGKPPKAVRQGSCPDNGWCSRLSIYPERASRCRIQYFSARSTPGGSGREKTSPHLIVELPARPREASAMLPFIVPA
jgi:hypothetical protein